MRTKKNKDSYSSVLDDVDLTNCYNCLIDNLENLTKCCSDCPDTVIKLATNQMRDHQTENPPGDPALKLTG